MVFNATFNNISVILCQSVLFVVETGPPGENHRPVTSHWQNLSHNVVSSTPRHERDSNHNLRGDRHWLHRVEHVSMHDKHNLALCLNELLYSRQNTTKTILLQWNLCEHVWTEPEKLNRILYKIELKVPMLEIVVHFTCINQNTSLFWTHNMVPRRYHTV